MPNRYSNIRPCPVCGRKSWYSKVLSEPVDPSGIWTFEKKKVEYRVCPCGHKERVGVVRDNDSDDDF